MKEVVYSCDKEFIRRIESFTVDIETADSDAKFECAELCVSPLPFVSNTCGFNVIGTNATDWEAWIEIDDTIGFTYPTDDAMLPWDVPVAGDWSLVDQGSYDDLVLTKYDNFRTTPTREPFFNMGELDNHIQSGVIRVPLVFRDDHEIAPVTAGDCAAVVDHTQFITLGSFNETSNLTIPAGARITGSTQYENHWTAIEYEELITIRTIGAVYRDVSASRWRIYGTVQYLHALYFKSGTLYDGSSTAGFVGELAWTFGGSTVRSFNTNVSADWITNGVRTFALTSTTGQQAWASVGNQSGFNPPSPFYFSASTNAPIKATAVSYITAASGSGSAGDALIKEGSP